MTRRVNCIATLKEHMIIRFFVWAPTYIKPCCWLTFFVQYMLILLYCRAMEVLDLLLTFQRNIRLKVEFYKNTPNFLITSMTMYRKLFLYHLLCYWLPIFTIIFFCSVHNVNWKDNSIWINCIVYRDNNFKFKVSLLLRWYCTTIT